MGDQDAGTGQPRMALVTSYDSTTGTAKVQLQPEGIQTGWLPVLSQGIGAGWGIVAALAVGDQVFVIPQEGDAEHGVIVGRVWSDQQQPPAIADGEVIIQHVSGSFIKMQADGTIQMTGDLYVTGAIYATKEITAKVGASQVRLTTHRHPANGSSPTPGS